MMSNDASGSVAGRRRGARRGRGAAGRVGAVSPAISSSSGVVSSTRGSRCGGSGVGKKRPSTGNELVFRMVEDIPPSPSLETPLTPARKRQRACQGHLEATPGPSRLTSPTKDVPSPMGLPPAKDDSMVESAENLPSLAMFTECGTGSGASTPRSSPLELTSGSSAQRSRIQGHSSHSSNPPARRYATQLNYGSDEESEFGDEEFRVVERLLEDTPLDEGYDAPFETEETLNASEGIAFLPYDLHRYEWKDFPTPAIDPVSRREQFTCRTGPNTPESDPYKIFRMIWDTEIINKIVSETNEFARQIAQEMMNRNALGPCSHIGEWRDTNNDEILVFFAIVLAMGVIVKARMEDYWCPKQSIFITPGFNIYMTLRRFKAINSCLHFANNLDMLGQNLSASEAKLFKIQPILDHLNDRFSKMYNLSQNISLDESSLQWKRWLNVRQVIPNKSAKVGVKMYAVCESNSGYLWRFKIPVNCRSDPVDPSDPLSYPIPSLVLNLLQGLESKGHTVWMDNFYNSPALARRLKSIGFDCAGTLRTNRQFVPLEITNLTKNQLKPGQIAGLTSGDIDLLVWRDKNRVATISTYHGNSVSRNSKPNVVEDYNICMGGVDKKNQLLSAYPIERKRTKVWYKKLFRHLLNISVVNSYIIHRKSPQPKLEHRNFRENLIKSIINHHHPVPPQRSAPAPLPPQNLLVSAIDVRIHAPFVYPFTKTAEGKHTARSRMACTVCHKRGNTYCRGCDKPCCLGECFVKMHE